MSKAKRAMTQSDMDHVIMVLFRLMVLLVVFAGFITLSGCSWIDSDAGKALYIYRMTTPDGTEHEIELKNAKDIGEVMATVKYGDIEVLLSEKGVNASSPMATMAEQNARMLEQVLGLIPDAVP